MANATVCYSYSQLARRLKLRIGTKILAGGKIAEGNVDVLPIKLTSATEQYQDAIGAHPTQSVWS